MVGSVQKLCSSLPDMGSSLLGTEIHWVYRFTWFIGKDHNPRWESLLRNQYKQMTQGLVCCSGLICCNIKLGRPEFNIEHYIILNKSS